MREVLAGLQRLAQAAAPFDPSTAQRRFSICIIDASHITLLPRLLAHVRALAPGVVLEAKRIDAGLLRHIDETLARSTGLNGLRVLPCPFEIPGFTVKQYWHARYHHDADSRWLRGICAELFMKSGSSADVVVASSY